MKAYYAVANGHCFHGVGLTPIQAYQNARQQMVANMHQVDETLKADPNCQTVTTPPEEVWRSHIFPMLRLAVIPEKAYADFKEHQAKDRWYYTYAIEGADIIDPKGPELLQVTVWLWAWAWSTLEAEWVPRGWAPAVPEEWMDAFLACASAMNFVELHPDTVDAHEVADMMRMLKSMYDDAFGTIDPALYEHMWNRKCEVIALRIPSTKEQK